MLSLSAEVSCVHQAFVVRCYTLTMPSMSKMNGCCPKLATRCTVGCFFIPTDGNSLTFLNSRNAFPSLSATITNKEYGLHT